MNGSILPMKENVSIASQKNGLSHQTVKQEFLYVNISVCEGLRMYQCSQLLQKQMLSHVPGVSEEKWIDAQKENVLDAPYYHVVFTVPEELNSIIYSNQKLLYALLYHAASATLNELSKDAKVSGGSIGVYLHSSYLRLSAMNHLLIFIPLFLEVGLMMKINGKTQVEIFFSHMVSSQSVPWKISG